MKLINIGFGSLIADGRLVSVLSPDSAPVKRMIQDTRERGLLVDASYGRRTRSVIFTDCGYVFLSALTPEPSRPGRRARQTGEAKKMQTHDKGR